MSMSTIIPRGSRASPIEFSIQFFEIVRPRCWCLKFEYTRGSRSEHARSNLNAVAQQRQRRSRKTYSQIGLFTTGVLRLRGGYVGVFWINHSPSRGDVVVNGNYHHFGRPVETAEKFRAMIKVVVKGNTRRRTCESEGRVFDVLICKLIRIAAARGVS